MNNLKFHNPTGTIQINLIPYNSDDIMWQEIKYQNSNILFPFMSNISIEHYNEETKGYCMVYMPMTYKKLFEIIKTEEYKIHDELITKKINGEKGCIDVKLIPTYKSINEYEGFGQTHYAQIEHRNSILYPYTSYINMNEEGYFIEYFPITYDHVTTLETKMGMTISSHMDNAVIQRELFYLLGDEKSLERVESLDRFINSKVNKNNLLDYWQEKRYGLEEIK